MPITPQLVPLLMKSKILEICLRALIYFSKTLFAGLIFGGSCIQRGLCTVENSHLQNQFGKLIYLDI